MEYRTKADIAANEIRRGIRSGRYDAGQRLDIDRLAEEFGMSATPVREALRLLGAESLVVLEPHRGFRVVDFTDADVDELYLIRSEIESFATMLSAARLTPADFDELDRLTDLQELGHAGGDSHAVAEMSQLWHSVVYRAATKTPYLPEFIDRLLHAFPWAGVTNPMRDPKIIADHRDLTRLLRARDGDSAARLMREHILSGRDFVASRHREPQDDPANETVATISSTSSPTGAPR